MSTRIAKLCYRVKQHIANQLLDTDLMTAKPINDVLAANLAHFMTKRGLTQAALASKCGIGQTTVSLYLDPSRRKIGTLGKPPSAKLSEVEMLAGALGVEVWELLRHLTPAQRDAYEQIEKVYQLMNPQSSAPNQSSQRAA